MVRWIFKKDRYELLLKEYWIDILEYKKWNERLYEKSIFKETIKDIWKEALIKREFLND